MVYNMLPGHHGSVYAGFNRVVSVYTQHWHVAVECMVMAACLGLSERLRYCAMIKLHAAYPPWLFECLEWFAYRLPRAHSNRCLSVMVLYCSAICRIHGYWTDRSLAMQLEVLVLQGCQPPVSTQMSWPMICVLETHPAAAGILCFMQRCL